MVDIIFIDDNYLYQNFPLPQRMERGALLALIQLEQYTSIQDLLGTCLYEDIETKVAAQTLNSSEQELFKMIKYSLAMFSARAAISILRSETSRTKNEESKSNQMTLDAISSSLESKLTYINKRIVNYILSDATIKATATASGCDDDLFESEDVFTDASIFYPKSSTSSGDC